MYELIYPVLFAAAGAWCGWMLPETAGTISLRKTGRIPLIQGLGKRLTGPLPRTASALSLAVVWAASALRAISPISALLVSLLISAAVLIALIDLLSRVVPNELVLIVILLGSSYQLTRYNLRHFLFAALALLFFLALFLLSAVLFGTDKIGAGDVKLAGAIGMVLGFSSALEAFAVMGISVLVFCLVGLSLHKLRRNSLFPFAPFMMLGMSVSLLHRFFIP